MPTRVRFRFNKVSGEVEEFVVDDQDRRLPEAEHDRIAADVADLVAVSPRIHEVMPGSAVPARREDQHEPEDEGKRERDKAEREGE